MHRAIAVLLHAFVVLTIVAAPSGSARADEADRAKAQAVERLSPPGENVRHGSCPAQSGACEAWLPQVAAGVPCAREPLPIVFRPRAGPLRRGLTPAAEPDPPRSI